MGLKIENFGCNLRLTVFVCLFTTMRDNDVATMNHKYWQLVSCLLSALGTQTMDSMLKPGFHSNAIACVRCINENRKKRKRLRENFTQQTQAPANSNARSK